MIHQYQFAQPNQIGDVPKSSSTIIIPPNSPRVLVGYSENAGNTILRIQYWERSPESISLAPKHKHVIYSSQQAGTTWSSSSEETLAEAASLSVGAGIGAFSVSASGSVSNSSTTGFSATEESDSETQIETRVENTTQHDIIAFEWRLVDETLVIHKDKYLASYAVAQSPSVIEVLEFSPGKEFIEQLELTLIESITSDRSGLLPGEFGQKLEKAHSVEEGRTRIS
ncbi:hypothetical protein EHO60_14455 [Leptospira fletcheri]|uniref:Uncharacterized protein n=1 Tax=Leptospira fletcheri TaxID=2484981 RepID=A0A4R9GBN0_9LEPT|nr:hypothetical protein [Leptospira fletcheri]TGK08775.1 hypothetical protein EHO60_14455 [Leptospira fletcheri]